MRKLVFALLFLSAALTSSAQEEVYSSSGKPLKERNNYKEEKGGFDPSRMIYGGGFVFGIGGGITNLGVSPVIGYRFTDNFAAGIGLGYQYFKAKNAFIYTNNQGVDQGYDIKTNIYTGSIWARYLFWRNLFVHVEPEVNSLEKFEQPYYDATGQFRVDRQRILVPCLLVGGGLRQPISDRVSFIATILYDVLQEPYSPYRGRIDIRLGVNVGF